MNTRWFSMALLSLGAFSTALPAAGSNCTSTPVTVTFQFSYTDPQTGAGLRAAIYSDGTSLNNPPYVNGQQGVTAYINCSGGDLVFDLGQSTRSIGFNFSSVLYSNSSTPGWITNPQQDPFYDKAHVTVRDVMFAYNPVADYQFTTRVGSQFRGPDGQTYFLRLVNPSDQAYTSSPEPAANYPTAPFNTSLVWVHHMTNPERWIIYPDSSSMGVTATGTPATEVASILKSSKTTTNVGQFSTPFYIVVTKN